MPLSKVHRNALIQHKNFKDFSEKGHSPLPKLHRDCGGANEFFWKGAQNWLRNDGYASIKNTQNAFIPHKNSKKKSVEEAPFPSPDPTPLQRGHPLPIPHPLGAYGASIPRLCRGRGLDAFGVSALSHYPASYSEILDAPLVTRMTHSNCSQ